MAKPFTIYVMQSAHTDIGYTHPQEQLEEMYLEYYDRVLDLCRSTSAAPEARRFKWTCETFWQVRHYLTHRPEREAEFLGYVRAGQIEITAAYAHFTDLIDADSYRRSVALAVEYCQQHALPLSTALHCDVNGWPWAVADILAEYNIPYFISQLNLDMGTDPLGARGSINYEWRYNHAHNLRPDVPTRIPQAFNWQGPRGGQVLHWLNEHYLLGNVLGLSGRKGFHADKTRYFTETDYDSADDLYAVAREEVPRYITYLRAHNYALDALLISTGGYYVDNSPPDTRWYEIIERWNREHEDIVLRTATVSEWFAYLTEHSTREYPTYQVAWPDSWAHGLGSGTAVTAQVRRTQRRRADVSALVEQAQVPKASAYFARALEQERMALEHTFGAWSTTGRPASWLNGFEQNVKELFFHRAELYLNEAVGAALRTGPRSAQHQPTLYAGSAERTAGEYLLHFTSEELHLDPAQQALRSEDGTLYAFQSENDELGLFAATVPLASAQLSAFTLVDTLATNSARLDTLQLEQGAGYWQVKANGWQARIDADTGSLRSLVEIANGREWINGEHEYGFGQLVHERVVHPWGWRAVGNEQRFLALGVASEKLKRDYPDVPVFERASAIVTGEPVVRHGPIFDELVFDGPSTSFGSIKLAWRFYRALPMVELVIEWDKEWCKQPEAAYITFPFANHHQSTLDLETGGGFFRPGSHASGGQLAGTCSSYYTMQHAARITQGDGARALWLPLDAPLVMTQELNYNRWETEPWEWNGFLASMPVNHYWHTNFPVSQRGRLRLRYRLLSQQGFASEEQAQAAALPVDALGWH